MAGHLSVLPACQDIAFIPTRAACDLPDGALRVYLALVGAGAEGHWIRATAAALARHLGYRQPITVRRRLLELEARGYASRITRGRIALWRVYALPLPPEERTHA